MMPKGLVGIENILRSTDSLSGLHKNSDGNFILYFPNLYSIDIFSFINNMLKLLIKVNYYFIKFSN